MKTKTFEVAVFAENGRRPGTIKCRAYTRDFNPKWSGYNGIVVDALNGTEAKKMAIAAIKRTYSARPDRVNVAAPFPPH